MTDEGTPASTAEAAGERRAGYVDKGTQILLSLAYRDAARRGELLPFVDVEFSNYSQTGEDGILHYVLSLVGTTNRTVVEMCAGNGIESNSANLLINHGWNGVLFEGDAGNVERARSFFGTHPRTWCYPPKVVHAWIDAENVNDLLRDAPVSGEVDLFCLDMDGVDYWIWKAITAITPRVVLLEIQASWLDEASVTVPYRRDFVAQWVDIGIPGGIAQYAGASLPAFIKLASEKGYRLIGGNRMGFNVVFLRNDVHPDLFPAVEPETIFADPVMNGANRWVRPFLAELDWEEV